MKRSSLIRVAVVAAPLAACGGSEPTGIDFELSCTVALDEIFDGGVQRDGIPALTNPEVVPAPQGTFLTDTSRVLGIVRNGEARAYPFTVMWWHEMVNDTLGGEPILMTYCPLTGSGIAFDPRVNNQARNFGVSGLLFRSNLTMFDRDTETLWNQMLLAGMCGLDRGKVLQRLPIVETTWSNWKSLHPSTTVMTENTGFADRPYGLFPYGAYAQIDNTEVGALTQPIRSRISDVRPLKEVVLGLYQDSSVVLYTFGVLAGIGNVVAVNDTAHETPVLVTYVASEKTAFAFDRRVGGQELTFTVASESPVTLMDNETNSEWDALGNAISGPMQGEQLTLITDSYIAYWFAWWVYYRDLEMFLAP